MPIPHAHPSPLAGVPPSVLGSLGERLSALAIELQQEAQLSPNGRERVGRLEQLGLELQALVHALGAAGWQPQEQVPILEAAQAARRNWLPELQRRGLSLQVQGEPACLELEPAQLQHALDLLIAHGLAGGAALQLRVLPAANPAEGVVIELAGPGPGPGATELHGQLLQWLARAQGWRCERPAPLHGSWLLRLQLGQPLGDVDTQGLPRFKWKQGARVLIVEPDDRYRVQASELLRKAGLEADGLVGLGELQRALQDGDPFAIVSGIALDEPEARAVYEPLRARLPGLRWVELVDAPHLFAAGSPDGQIPARISRADLAHTLLPSLAL